MPLPVKFLKSAVHEVDYPKTDRPEIALAGRSNAGKSSFLNCVTHSKIAKVSQEPGKTRLLNFFDVGQNYRIVDMPGYGFASRSGSEIKEWTAMVEHYLANRTNLVGLLLVMDIRRDWTQDEEILVQFMNRTGRPVIVLPSKIDRCSRQEIADRVQAIREQSRVSQIWPISSTKNTGVSEVEDYFFKTWIKPGIKGAK